MFVTYSSDNVDRIKEAVPIADLIEQYIPLKKSGKNLVACCPFHEEKTPSFVVNAEEGYYKCFGCGESGDVLTFVMKKEHLDFPQALRFLADRYNIPLEEDPENKKKRSRKQKLYEINKEAMLFYYKNLLTSSAAKTYLMKRELSYQVINPFLLGYADGYQEKLYDYLHAKGYEDEDMLELGLIAKSNRGVGFYDRFRKRLIFPIISKQNRIIGFGGRILDQGQPKYLNSPESEIFHKGDHLYGIHILKQKKKIDKVLLVEGYMDVISLYQRGIDFSLASLGTAFTKEQAIMIQKMSSQVFLCYDGDHAGITASRRAIQIFAEISVIPKLVILPEDLDPDDYCKKYGVESFYEKMDQALDPVDFEIQLMAAKYDLSDFKEQLDFLREATSFLAQVEGASVRELYVKKISNMLDLDEEGLNRDVEEYRVKIVMNKKLEKKTSFSSREGKSPSSPVLIDEEMGKRTERSIRDIDDQRLMLEYEVIRLSAQSPKCFEILHEERESFILSDRRKKILHIIEELQRKKLPSSIDHLRDNLGSDFQEDFFYLTKHVHPKQDEDKYLDNAQELKGKIAYFLLKERKKLIGDQLRLSYQELEEKGLDPLKLIEELKELDIRLKAERGQSYV